MNRVEKTTSLLSVFVIFYLLGPFLIPQNFNLALGQLPPEQSLTQPIRELRAFSAGLVSVKEPFSASPGEGFLAHFTLPPGTIMETLKAHGIKTNLIRKISPHKTLSLLAQGDLVEILTEEMGSFKGEVLNPNGWSFGNEMLCIKTSNDKSYLCLLKNEIFAIKVLKLTDLLPFEDRLETKKPLIVEVQGVAQNNTPFLSYLVRDMLAWKPIYTLELSTGQMSAFIFSDNLFDFPKTSMTFVMGMPHLVSGGYKAPSRGMDYMAIEAVPAPSAAPTIVGELWEYPFEGTIELKEGESIQLPLFDALLMLKPIYYWNGGDVLLKHRFVNDLDRPLAPGRVECYENDLWVGEDLISWVAIGEEGEVTSQYAKDIEVEERTIYSREDKDKRTVEKEISIYNHKSGEISMEVVRYLPYRSNLKSASPKPSQEGDKLTWSISLKPDEKKSIRYRYEQILKSD